MPAYNTKELFTDIVLIDIINFSQLTSKNQLEIVNFITQSYKKVIEKMLKSSGTPLEKLVVGFVPTGDGFYCILHPRIRGFGAILGMSFNHLSDQISKKYTYFSGVRIAVHTGEVNEFIDILGHKNYIGHGLNDCARYLEIKEYSISTVMVSDIAYENLKNFFLVYPDFEELLHQRELKHSKIYTFYDKHGNEKRGFLVWLRKSGIINPPYINLNAII
jgi:hypothetical protein